MIQKLNWQVLVFLNNFFTLFSFLWVMFCIIIYLCGQIEAPRTKIYFLLYITIFADTSSLKVGPTTMEGQGNPAESQLIFFYNFLDDDGDDGDDERYLWYLDGVIRPLVADFP